MYPFFNNKLNSESLRLRFIQSQADNGYLFYKMIVKGIETKLLESKDSRLVSLNKHISNLKNKYEEIQRELGQYDSVYTVDPCQNLRLTNIYHSENDLLRANNTDIFIDSDKLLHGEKSNYVENDNYAILIISDTEKKLYKREFNKWVETQEGDVESILNDSAEICNRGMTLDVKTKLNKVYKKPKKYF